MRINKSLRERIEELVSLLPEKMGAVPPTSKMKTMDQLIKEMKLGRASIKRIFDEADLVGIRKKTHREGTSWYYYLEMDEEAHPIELRLSRRETSSLLAISELISDLDPELKKKLTDPITKRLKGEHPSKKELWRVRLLSLFGRETQEGVLADVSQATLERLQLEITYEGEDGDKKKKPRQVSPQQLVSYRGNWYLDAWCHDKDELRTFAIDQIGKCSILDDKPAQDKNKAELEQYYTGSFGIFGGLPREEWAKLIFTPFAKRWVARETWHPEEKGEHFGGKDTLPPDRPYHLELPFGQTPELVAEILKWGEHVEVIGPPELREEVAKKLLEAKKIYYGNGEELKSPPGD